MGVVAGGRGVGAARGEAAGSARPFVHRHRWWGEVQHAYAKLMRGHHLCKSMPPVLWLAAGVVFFVDVAEVFLVDVGVDLGGAYVSVA